MGPYILKRLLLIFPTLFGILALNFTVTQLAPGGPIQTILAQVKSDIPNPEAIGGHTPTEATVHPGADPKFVKTLEKQFGFDQPVHIRFFKMVRNYLRFDFGDSYFKGESVASLIKSRLPVSFSLGFWSLFFIYLIAIPLGIRKAVWDGKPFDLWSSGVMIVCYALPSFLLALFLIILFAGGSFWKIFPLRGLVSDSFDQLSLWGKAVDYLWHLCLPIGSIVLSSFAKLTLLMKNSFLEELNKPYVLTARSKGASERRILYGHVFRNSILILLAGFPAIVIHTFFSSSLLIETLFSLDGLGLLGFEAALNRDYPVLFGTLYIYTLIGLVLHLIGDLLYTLVDPRINLAAKRG